MMAIVELIGKFLTWFGDLMIRLIELLPSSFQSAIFGFIGFWVYMPAEWYIGLAVVTMIGHAFLEANPCGLSSLNSREVLRSIGWGLIWPIAWCMYLVVGCLILAQIVQERRMRKSWRVSMKKEEAKR